MNLSSLQNLNFANLMRDIYNIVLSFDGHVVNHKLLQSISDALMGTVANNLSDDLQPLKSLPLNEISEILVQFEESGVISLVPSDDEMRIVVNHALAQEINGLWELLGATTEVDVEATNTAGVVEDYTAEAEAEFDPNDYVYVDILTGNPGEDMTYLDTLQFYNLQSAKDFVKLNLEPPFYGSVYVLEEKTITERKELA